MTEFPAYQPSFFENLLSRALPEIARHVDPICKKTFWNYRPWTGEPRSVETQNGARAVCGIVQGYGRVIDVFQHGDGSVEVTFGHGKFASRLSEGTVIHKWLRAGEEHAPIISAPSEKLAADFAELCFSIKLYPVLQPDGSVAAPRLSPRDLVAYQLLALDAEGREGVAVKIAPSN